MKTGHRAVYRLYLPWDARKYWPETIALPLLAILAGIALIAVAVGVSIRAVPALHFNSWVFMGALLVLVYSTYLGILHQYLGLLYSIRLFELMILLVISAFATADGAPNAGSLWLAVGTIAGAWTLAMHYSHNFVRIWPPLTAGNNSLAILIEQANMRAEKTREADLTVFMGEFRTLMLKMSRLVVAFTVLTYLVQPEPRTSGSLGAWLGVWTGIFALATVSALSFISLIRLRRQSDSKSIRMHSALATGWLSSISGLLAISVLIAVLLPSNISPISSPGMTEMSDKGNDFMSAVTESVGEMLVAGRDFDITPSSPIKGASVVESGLMVALRILESLVRTDEIQGQWSIVSLVLSILSIGVAALGAGIAIWCMVWLGAKLLGFILKRRFRVEVKWLTRLLIFVTWPIVLILALIRLVKWLSSLAAAWIAGRMQGEGKSHRFGLSDLISLAKAYARVLPGIPKDYALFIRYIFARFITIAMRRLSLVGKSYTAGDYSKSFSDRWPEVKAQVDNLTGTYEAIRYGLKKADKRQAAQAESSYGKIKRGLK